MTTLSADELTVMRKWVGSADLITDAELQALFDVYDGHYDNTVLHVLNARLVELASQPSSLTVPGLSISNTNNMEELRATIKDFYNEGGTGLHTDGLGVGGFTIGRLTRPDAR